VDARAVAERVWPGTSPRIEVLGGGLTNHNYKVTLDDGDAYVVRVAGRDTHLLGVDREIEHGASRLAAAAGVGPEVVAFVDGCLVTRFVGGEIVPLERMREPETVRRVGDALARVHRAGTVNGTFDAFRVVEDYRDTALARGGAVPERFEHAHALARRIERTRAGAPVRFCHNDLLNANFIDSPDGIRIVDWEYAGMGDPFFDLANFAANHDLDHEGARTLLRAYAGAASEEDERSLVLMRFMSDFREAMWCVVQTAVSELDVDFESYAAEHFDRLERTATSPEFRAALP
jgi:thiamine kinase-like enzyme